MSIGDLLSGIGRGTAAVLQPLAERTAEVVSGQAPELDQERRQQALQLTNQQRELKANELEQQLEMGRKYGTLNADQQKQYVDAIAGLYSKPEDQGSLLQRIHKAIHPQGTTRQAAPQPLPNAVPEGGTAAVDEQRAIELAQARQKPNLKNFKNVKTGEQMSWDTNQGVPGPDWILTGTGAGYIRQGSHVLNPKDATTLLNSGMATFKKQDGESWTAKELENFPPGIVLAQFIEGNDTFYAPVNQRTKTATWGNVVHQINEAGQIDPETATPLGQARVPTVQTQTAPGGGQVVTQTTTPQTTGAVLRSAPAPSTGARPVAPTTPGGVIRNSAPSQPEKSILPDIQRMTPRNAEMARKAQPAVTALLGMYGDPQNPSVPSMMDFSKLADDPHAQKVLGEAFKMLDQSMGEISDPGIIQTLGTAGGWANFRARVESQAQQSPGTRMTDAEKAYFDTAIASMADVIGSRSATGQSPARFSVKSIQNELPLIGLPGTPDSTSYNTKMKTLARQIEVGLNAMPDNSRALAWLKKREGQLGHPTAGAAMKKSPSKHYVGEKVKLRNGQTITIQNVYPDGSFD